MAGKGKPTKYKPEYADQLPAMFESGESVAEVALKFGVSRQTFYDWTKAHKEFAAAYEQGKLASEAWWNRLGRAGAAGTVTVNATVWIFNMKNRFGWTDRIATDNKIEGDINNNHTITVVESQHPEKA